MSIDAVQELVREVEVGLEEQDDHGFVAQVDEHAVWLHTCVIFVS